MLACSSAHHVERRSTWRCAPSFRSPLSDLRGAPSCSPSVRVGPMGSSCVTPSCWRRREPLQLPASRTDPGCGTRRVPSASSPDVSSLWTRIVAVAGLALLGAFFRPLWVEFVWKLPGTVWLLLTLGVGTAVGLLTHAIVAGSRQGPQFFALCLGSVAFAAGIAGFLLLSPLVICFIVGALLVNLPGAHKQRLWRLLTQLERPIYYLFLTIVGALWDITGWRGWVLVPVFVVSRGLGNFFAEWLVRQHGDTSSTSSRRMFLLAPPVSIVSIAIVISAQGMYRGRAISWIVTAVLGGAILAEVLHRRGVDR